MPTLAGALWLWWAAQGGAPGALLGGLPGTLLLATGLSNLLWAGDARIFHFMSLGALLGILFAFPAVLVFGPVVAAVLLVLSAVSFVAAGHLSVGQEPVPEGLPQPRMRPGMAIRAAEDELSMCTIVLTTWPLSVGGRAARIGRELDEGLALFEERGWFRDPILYHQDPPPIEELRGGDRRHPEDGFEHLTFESSYEPWVGEPGREVALLREEPHGARLGLEAPGRAAPVARVPARDTDGLPPGGPRFLQAGLPAPRARAQPPLPGPADPWPAQGRAGERRPHPLGRRDGLAARRLPGHVGRAAPDPLAPPQRGRAGHRSDRALPRRVRGSVALVSRTRRLRGRRQPGRGPVASVLAQRPLPARRVISRPLV